MSSVGKQHSIVCAQHTTSSQPRVSCATSVFFWNGAAPPLVPLKRSNMLLSKLFAAGLAPSNRPNALFSAVDKVSSRTRFCRYGSLRTTFQSRTCRTIPSSVPRWRLIAS
eukprot:scaffold1017_cov374-Prasinococcus_capsulatus_cf.AAC.11